MLVLYETPLGFCLFKFNQGKVKGGELYKEFETPERANKVLKLKALHRFASTAEAVEDITALQDGKVSKGLEKFLNDEIVAKGKGKEVLSVIDPKLAGSIKDALGIQALVDGTSMDVHRGIRGQLASLLDGLDATDFATMSLGLSHSLSRFKVKFSPDKVDTMVVQAIGLLDDLDKEINIYAMRVKEWYGWHFPEMGKIITDNLAYAKVVREMGFRTNAATTSLAAILPEELEATVKAAAEISMGTEISDQDIDHIHALCDQVISITEYRSQLAEYLRNRMNAIAPNLTALVGELVGARLISHAGSLMSLAKHPASTVQILGAEKALFRALKTKHDTPKYGLIYHASLVGQAPPKLKGKMARMVATKAALSIRVDALADADTKSDPMAPTIGIENRAKLESRLRALEYRNDLNGTGRGESSWKKQQRFEMTGETKQYNTAADSVDITMKSVGDALSAVTNGEKKKSKEERKKEKAEKKARRKSGISTADVEDEPVQMAVDAGEGEDGETEEQRKARKKAKKEAKKAAAAAAASAPPEEVKAEEPKKSKKRRASEAADIVEEVQTEKKKKKKRKSES
ncbi:hypothetical protein BOTBODRAFT_124315 [Botryobasidium botryosum FD-172 SS1]|uniref:Nucleolar protein 58 n=1 Tax=Botryobasidium botryosum (strain FD-172 SS1) TaxID=930990 RepID=A0A067N912_BOTB1|nr:hypothetical protein BOTBODRAFT_124315 [Botryobasidium botryosum FD-172 SS1]